MSDRSNKPNHQRKRHHKTRRGKAYTKAQTANPARKGQCVTADGRPKQAYRFKSDAEAAAAATLDNGRQGSAVLKFPLEAYRCRKCDNYHLGHSRI